MAAAVWVEAGTAHSRTNGTRPATTTTCWEAKSDAALTVDHRHPEDNNRTTTGHRGDRRPEIMPTIPTVRIIRPSLLVAVLVVPAQVPEHPSPGGNASAAESAHVERAPLVEEPPVRGQIREEGFGDSIFFGNT